MNRISEYRTSANYNLGSRQDAVDLGIESSKRLSNNESFFIPAGYTPRYDYPLIVWLHHDGGSERDVAHVVPHMSVQNYLGVGVRGCRAIESSGLRFGWSDSATGTAVAEQAVLNAIDVIADRYSVNRQKVFLVGYCEGGSAALRIGLRHPNLFAGIATLGGKLPDSGRLLCNLQAARELPLYLATYRDSEQWPVEQVCQNVRLLHAARMKAEVRQYPLAGDLCTQMLGDLNRWVMSIVLNTPITEESSGCLFSNN